MFRKVSWRGCKLVKQKPVSIVQPISDIYTPSAGHGDVSPFDGVGFTPISRYVPTDPTAFLVEEHRLTSGEKLIQSVTSVFPWLFLAALGLSPFFVMKYNLNKLSQEVYESPAPRETEGRLSFRHISYSDMPEVIERRNPTLVGVYTDNYHSMIYLPLFREIDSLLGLHKIQCSVCIFPAKSANSDYLTRYPAGLSPQAQLVLPGNKVVDFEGRWSSGNLLEFLIPDKKITASMKQALTEMDAKVSRLEECVFRRRFAASHAKWTIEDSLASESLDAALARCEISP